MTWRLNDSIPLSLGMEFEPPPLPWTMQWWGPPLAIVLPQAAQPTNLSSNLVMGMAFFGPKG